ncbi:CDP-glucose 4,6-dehydratase [Herbaspirillum sp. DW155]|uniref:CDP-glucose 4,6-dehydratase n=1 Tax=Herbaspirillum sp. DW155 TaxID=3095609 RepID=UPI00308544D1|nr:CDP-glucose 4,6-dehydratase [Herbaspirillum sp. DW155]
MNRAFWKNRRVFVTGHTGFKGSWLCLWLQSMQAEVTGYALPPPTQPSLFETARVADGMTSIIGNVQDPVALNAAIQKAQPEVVIHMAAQPLVRYSYDNPVETYLTNVMGPVYLFEAIRQVSSVRAIVNVTTDKCYENKEWLWSYRENEPMGGYDPYSNSKGCSELVTAAYRNSYFNPARYDEHGVALASARAGNVIGGGDWALDRLIPDIMQAIVEKRSVQIRNPHAIRPWQHVLEPLSGYLTLAEKLVEEGAQFAQGWNFGPRDEDARPVQWLVEKLTEYWGEGANWALDARPQPHEANYLKLDISKAGALLGWQPRWKLEHTLQTIVDWGKAFRAHEDMRALTLNQITAYERWTQ